MQFAIVSIALITWMFLVFPGADSDDMDSEMDPSNEAEKKESAAECFSKHGGRCVKVCDTDEVQIQSCGEDFCCREKCD